MQTLTNSALEFRRDDTQVVIFDPSGQNLGHIGFDITRNQWCYVPYGQPIKTTGTLEACQSAAEADYTEQQSHEATVTHIDADAKPAYVHRHTSWRAAGSGYEQTVTVQQGKDTYRVLVPAGFARQLRVGSVIELHYDQLGGLYLKWCLKPVRRSAIAA